MRNIYIFFILAVSFGNVQAQSERIVLIEENTNVSSAASAAQNPAFNALLDANTDRVVQISYHTEFPSGDPLYQDNVPDNDNRISYNSAVYIPVAILDGQIINDTYPGFNNSLGGSPQGFSQTTFDYAKGIPASFDIDLDYSLTPDGINISATATCSQSIGGDLKFHIAVIEKKIQFPIAPGSNGETTFRNVMKKMLPDANGASMNNSYLPGNTFSTSVNWEFENIYDPNQIAVVAYIQNDNNHKVLQAAFSDSETFGPTHALDARVMSVTGLPESTCTAEITPSIVIRNNGSNMLTSLIIEYNINGSTATQSWNGSLSFYETQTVSLGNIPFAEEDENILEVAISNPNGATDEVPENDSFSIAVNFAETTTLHSTLEVLTDNYPVETSWSIRNSNDEPIATYHYAGTAQGGGADANTTHSHSLVLNPYECYTFTLYDDGGDGMVSSPVSPGPFGYRILNGYGDIIIDKVLTTFPFGYDTSQLFRTDNITNIENKDISTNLLFYPNPSQNDLNISLGLAESGPVKIEIFNTLGQNIFQMDLGILPEGKTVKEIDISSLKTGIYLVSVSQNESKAFRKISVIK